MVIITQYHTKNGHAIAMLKCESSRITNTAVVLSDLFGILKHK